MRRGLKRENGKKEEGSELRRKREKAKRKVYEELEHSSRKRSKSGMVTKSYTEAD